MVSNGQIADQDTFNNAFMSRTDDTSTVGKVDLSNTDSASGSSIANIQRELNANESYTGMPAASVKTVKPSWASNIVGLVTDSIKLRIDALVALFHATTGHAHTGASGDGPQLSTDNLSSSTTASTDKDTGCLILNGGLGVEKNINAGGTVLGTNLSGTNTGDSPLVAVGSRASPTAVVAGTGVVASNNRRELRFIAGSSSAMDITANPQIAAGVNVGDELILRVPVGSNTILFENGNGLSQNGDFLLGSDVFSAFYVWDGTEWFLTGRD